MERKVKRMNQPKSERRRKDINYCLGSIFLLMLLPVFFFSIASWMYVTIPDRYQAEVKFRARAILTSGIVTQKNQQTNCSLGLGACTSSCDMTIRFQPSQGKTIVFSNICTAAKRNQTVPVLYDPDSVPVKARIDVGDSPESRANSDRLTSLIFALLGIGSLAAGFSISGTSPTQT